MKTCVNGRDRGDSPYLLHSLLLLLRLLLLLLLMVEHWHLQKVLLTADETHRASHPTRYPASRTHRGPDPFSPLRSLWVNSCYELTSLSGSAISDVTPDCLYRELPPSRLFLRFVRTLTGVRWETRRGEVANTHELTPFTPCLWLVDELVSQSSSHML